MPIYKTNRAATPELRHRRDTNLAQCGSAGSQTTRSIFRSRRASREPFFHLSRHSTSGPAVARTSNKNKGKLTFLPSTRQIKRLPSPIARCLDAASPLALESVLFSPNHPLNPRPNNPLPFLAPSLASAILSPKSSRRLDRPMDHPRQALRHSPQPRRRNHNHNDLRLVRLRRLHDLRPPLHRSVRNP